ncbi:CYFA0S13e02388g1_1 [Cyberlindnera fabianii]|uniref:CYFA0S13e02388g1_1 n=1 Tax=Cyberlindnera fabianii TaxID=36022 RepID=A0A061B2N9_CYBFA|nr:CYFA0S13e02388g1_1 [Cyberlindnera fabianii]
MAGDPFLSDPSKRKNKNKRRAQSAPQSNKRARQDKSTTVSDEEISGISDSEDEQGNVSYDDESMDTAEEIDSEEEFANENAADKRRRLAKQYLENLKQEVGEYDFDAKDLDEEIISKRLKEDVAETKGHVYRFIADNLLLSEAKTQVTRVGSKSLTGLSVRYPFAYTVSKDMELVKYDIKDFEKKPLRLKHTKGGKRFAEIDNDPTRNGHSDEILAVSASPNGKWVVTGGRDKKMVVWSTESLACQRVIETRQRDGVVLGLVFRRNSDDLYAACADLKVRTYSVGNQATKETLYGHQDAVVDVSALGQERCVTVGARDRCAMLWKIPEESRLTFRGGESEKKKSKKNKKKTEDDEMDVDDDDDEPFFAEGSIDCVSMIDDSHFVTGSDNGSISLWSLAKKKPLFIQHTAHGLLPQFTPEQASAEADPAVRAQQVPAQQPYWITAVHAIPYSNVFLSGSWNGEIKLWKLDENLRGFTLLGSLPNAKGIVTRIETAESGAHGKESIRVIAALSKEHRLGRWIDTRIQGARNSLYSAVIDQQVLKQ